MSSGSGAVDPSDSWNSSYGFPKMGGQIGVIFTFHYSSCTPVRNMGTEEVKREEKLFSSKFYKCRNWKTREIIFSNQN